MYTTTGHQMRKRSRLNGPLKGIHIKYFIPSFRKGTDSKLAQVCQKIFVRIVPVSQSKIQRICEIHFHTGQYPSHKRVGILGQ